ncbi:class I SAM-dependent DNA methyltransferase [Chondromyces apiculatus]|uniref:site-specific DNA-methyltransferase (adenine-specific) n=1 Tax=Chondromyces apiculatus DSM 436 TaxID=1192034 RepID=A0A017T118_9BACT|nr:class I SAM-dependent DNA methyltransferase [Chondromyces apiculatus]EYF02682.1 Type I restriction-modification system, DNA-methyltransferase subunit M [Chondromyces apiculatus DSM 436]
MITKRDVLEKLTRDELAELAERHDVPVRDRRSRGALVDGLEAHAPAVAALLGGYSRDRLKELCRALGLEDGGREKALLLGRLGGGDGTQAEAAEGEEDEAPVRGGRGRAAPVVSGSAPGTFERRGSAPGTFERRGPTPTEVLAESRAGRMRVAAGSAPASGGGLPVEQLELAVGGKLTPAELQKKLWAAADILRGSIDSSDYKSYIFGLVFLKRLSDRFEEECEVLRAEGVDPEDRDEHPFYVPKQARWAEIRKKSENLGEVLNKACHALEDENRSLQGVLAGIDFNDERRLGDAHNRESVLDRLLKHFSGVNLRNDHLSEPDMLGNAYEYLIEKFADDAGKKGGEFRTPEKVVDLVVALLEPREGMRICDPTCGSGGMLLGCAQYVKAHGGNPVNLGLFGQEKNLGTWSICKMNMLLHGRLSDRIEKGDTIRLPRLLQGEGKLMVFDRVLANPPFSLDEWGRDMAEKDPFRRFGYGLAPKTKGDLAFLQHMVATLNEKGKAGVVMPHGVLFRGGAEGEIRKRMLEEDLFEAVIGLPPNLFFGTGIPAAILVLSKAKPAARKGKVLFVDASREFQEGSARNYLRDSDVEKIVQTFREFAAVERYARVVEVKEIGANDWNLSISRYVETAEKGGRTDLGAAIGRLREAERARQAAMEKMNGFLKELGYGG